MNTVITVRLTYRTETNMLKTVHSEPFSNKSVKVKIFILQIDNKIADAAEASEERKIRYEISLLKESAAE